ncbi:MAG: oligosaccharide flippase family protein [Candidatus Zixiibacteriota bacterium]
MRKLFKNMSIYGLGASLAKAIQYFLLPVYTRILTPADYGSLELVYMIAAIVTIFYGFMISSGYIRIYYDRKDEEFRQKLLGSAFWFTIGSSAIIVSLIFTYSEQLASRIFDFENGSLFIRLVAVAMAIKAHSMIFYNVLMVREKVRKYVTINIIALLLAIVITIYFVVILRWSIKGVLLGQLIAYAIEFMILSALLVRKNIISLSLPAVVEMLKYSIPLMPLQFASFVLTLSDRFFLQEYKNLDDVGLYSLGYKFAAILPLLTIEPFRAFGPHIFNLIDKPDECKKTISDFIRYFMAFSLFLTLAIAMYSRETIMIMSDSSFHQGYKVVFLLCLSYVFYGLSNLFSYGINIVKKNWIITIAWLVATSLNIVLNFVLIPEYGIIGASIATVISYLILVIIKAIGVRAVYPISVAYGKVIFVFILSSAVYYLSTLLESTLLLTILYKLFLLLNFVLIIFLTRYFTIDERSKIKKLIGGLFKK